jgi:hypothetical protein
MHCTVSIATVLWLTGAAPCAQDPPSPQTPPAAGAQDPKAEPKPAAGAQDPKADPKAAPAQDPKAAAAQDKPLGPEHLEQLVAPIALYPDSLLAQALMASTYPLEIVQAARWVKQNASLKGDALEKALQSQTWDPSVKGLCGLPSVLNKMNDNLDWTQDLGDAFLADKNALMEAVQRMRTKAYEAGNLKTGKEQTVTQREDKVIVIESADPQVVYVPTYYPTAVYGGWAYPTYYYPPMYAPPPVGYAAFSFAVGVAWGAAIWGGCSWGHNDCDVNINVNKHNNFVNRTENNVRRNDLQKGAGASNWKHDASHRQGVRYKDQATAKQFGGTGASNRVSGDQARGRAGSANRPSTGTRPAQQPRAGTGNRAAAQPRASTKGSTGQRSGSFSGSNSAGATRAASQRGSTSRGGGASRPSGGSRGGGGGRGGGGRR